MNQFKTNLAKHYHEVYFGGNWTASSFLTAIEDVSFEEATKVVHNLNSILTLTYHIHYYTHTVLQYLNGKEFKSSDKDSFIVKNISNEHEWNDFKSIMAVEATAFVQKMDNITIEELDQDFIKEAYGSKFRNYHGIIEHTHYHLGQIQLIKNIIRQ